MSCLFVLPMHEEDVMSKKQKMKQKIRALKKERDQLWEELETTRANVLTLEEQNMERMERLAEIIRTAQQALTG